MGRLSIWVLAGALLFAAPATAAPLSCDRDLKQQPKGDKSAPKSAETRRPDDHGPWKFWEGESKAELGISNLQAAEIEGIFQSTFPKLEASKQALDKLEAALAQTIKENKAAPAAVGQQLDQVNAARAELYKTRTLMLYRMRGVLSAEQRAKLQAMWEAKHRKPMNETSGKR